MNNLVTHIWKKDENSSDPRSILLTKLENGDILTIETLLEYIFLGFDYYFKDHNSNLVAIEARYPLYQEGYIESQALYNGIDELLLIPSF